MEKRRFVGPLMGSVLGSILLLVGCTEASPVLPSDAEQGLDGLVLLGPQCPVEQEGAPCPDAPYAAVIDVRDGGGDHVTRIRSDENGRFRLGLLPGRYRLEPRNGDPFPHASPLEVTVRAREWLAVTVYYDTGIR